MKVMHGMHPPRLNGIAQQLPIEADLGKGNKSC